MKPSPRSSSVRIHPPELGDQLAQPLLPIDRLQRGAQLSEHALSDWNLAGQCAESVFWEQLLIERGTFSNTALRRIKARDVQMFQSDLSNADWSYAVLERVEVLSSRLTGWRLVEAKVQDVRWVGCKADLAQFRYTSFRDVRFEDCILRDADFTGAQFKGVAFAGCDLSGANFTGAKLAQVDFRGTRLEGAAFRPEDLKGAIIDSGQAIALSVTLAELLGMTILD